MGYFILMLRLEAMCSPLSLLRILVKYLFLLGKYGVLAVNIRGRR